LGKWLRLIGYDCASDPQLFGRDLGEFALKERRWVLTRNRRFFGDLPLFLLSRADIHLIVAEQLADQVREVEERFSLETNHFVFTRCLVCNEPLSPVAKSDVTGAVPPQVFARESEFWQCRHCGRTFWRGSHVAHSLRRLEGWFGNSANSP